MMARNFFAMSESDRSFGFNSLWFGLIDTVAVIVLEFVPGFDRLQDIALCIMSGSLIGLIFIGLHDEFVQRVVGRAATFACAAAGVLAVFHGFPFSRFGAVPPVLAFALISLAFHLPLAIMRLREE